MAQPLWKSVPALQIVKQSLQIIQQFRSDVRAQENENLCPLGNKYVRDSIIHDSQKE